MEDARALTAIARLHTESTYETPLVFSYNTREGGATVGALGGNSNGGRDSFARPPARCFGDIQGAPDPPVWPETK